MAILPGFVTALVIAAAKSAVRFQTAMANRRAAKTLLDWDARALKDIGLTRGDVRGALAEPLSADPTEFLSLIAAGREVSPRRDGANRMPTSGLKPVGQPSVSKGRLGNLPSAEPVLCS